jgi:osmoprotectant transport system substrate-binding protein
MIHSRRRLRRQARWSVLLGLALLGSACGGDDGAGGANGDSQGPLTLSSADFTENEIVARMYALALEQAGFEIEGNYQLGARAVILPEFESGGIDVYPEYIGSALEELSPGAATADTEESLSLLREQFEERGGTVLDAAEAQDKNGLVVTQETADELGLANVSDLAEAAGDLTLGGPPECPERPLCAPGYEETYGITFGEFVPLDSGGPLTSEALASGDIDVALLFTTDGIIAENEWVLLEDDQGLQPAENLVPVVRTEILTDEIEEALNSVSAVLTTEALTELNRRVNADAEDPEEVARTFLVDEGVLEE